MKTIDRTDRSAIAGRIMPGFEALADTFEGILAGGLEAGAACAVFKDGVLVADLWGGLRDRARALPWGEDTLVPVYSVTKGVAALAVLHLVDQGLIKLDAPLSRFWPEFAVHGKQDLTVRAMLGHRAGLPFIEGEVALEELADPVHMAARLAAQAPYFEPGASHMYHALTIGWLTGELLRRVGGQSVGPYVAALADRLGIELHMGLPEAARPRVAVLEVQTPQQHAMMREFCPPGSVAWKTLTLNGTVTLLPDAALKSAR
jgi:CubicO group peptidase (beta-lactamase class C family)